MDALAIEQHDAHYLCLPDAHRLVLHNAIDDNLKVVPLESEKRDFTLALWTAGYALAEVVSTQLPAWLIEGFEQRGYANLSQLSDFSDGLFNKAEFNIEVFTMVSGDRITYYRMMATLDGDTYISHPKGFIHTPERFTEYMTYIEPMLENLLADA